MPLAFVLDEHLRGPLWHAILRHNLTSAEYPLDVVRIGDFAELPLGSTDAEILLWAEKERRILITEDRHTMLVNLRSHLASEHNSPGVIIARPGQSARTLADTLC
jgi:hypothetical protein